MDCVKCKPELVVLRKAHACLPLHGLAPGSERHYCPVCGHFEDHPHELDVDEPFVMVVSSPVVAVEPEPVPEPVEKVVAKKAAPQAKAVPRGTAVKKAVRKFGRKKTGRSK